MTLAELVIAWLLVRSAAIASAKLGAATGPDKDFYAGKIAATRWFCVNVCPGARLARQLIEAGSLDLMAVPEASF
jgi:hypothetical protein